MGVTKRADGDARTEIQIFFPRLVKEIGTLPADKADIRTVKLARLGAADKSYRILPHGSHFVSLERNAVRVFDAVQEFLDR